MTDDQEGRRTYERWEPDTSDPAEQLRELVEELELPNALDRLERTYAVEPASEVRTELVQQYAGSWVPRTITKVRRLCEFIERQRSDDPDLMAQVAPARAAADAAEGRARALADDYQQRMGVLGADGRAHGESDAWLVLQVPDSEYSDVEGEAYHFPMRTIDASGRAQGRSIPNASRITAGDYIVATRTAKTSDGDGRIFGVGLVGDVVPGSGEATARYSAYAALEPAVAFDEVGGDPRTNQTNAINRVDIGWVDRVLASRGMVRGDLRPVSIVGAGQEEEFDHMWRSLTSWLEEQREWTTLEGVPVTFIDATEERIKFHSAASAHERMFLRRVARSAIETLQRESQRRNPSTFELAPLALLAHLPHIEYGEDLRTLYWMDMPTHELGTLKMRGAAPSPPSRDPAVSSPPTRDVSTIIRAAVAATGLWFDPWVVDDVYLSLRTKPLLLLTGLSGTGKTKVAQALQDVLCDDETRAFVSVRPDWTDSRSLLGYHNLLTDRFHATDMTRFLMDAAAEWDDRGPAARPYLLILDEMNLARVEHYFSDFLSVLESRRVGADGALTSEPIRLHGATTSLPIAEDEAVSIPPTAALAPNVYVIGTVNVDETTHPFSRKVLDRAMTIELFDVDLRGRSSDAARPTDDERALVRRHFSRDGRFVDVTEPALDEPWIGELVSINAALAPYRLHVGYRVRNEILAFVRGAGEAGLLGHGTTVRRRAFDLAITQKILPRLAGSQERLWKPLVAVLDRLLEPSARRQGRVRSLADDPAALYRDLEGMLGGDGWGAVEEVGDDMAPDSDDAGILSGSVHDEDEGEGVAKATRTPLSAAEVRYPRAARKVARMLLQLRDEGYTSFFE